MTFGNVDYNQTDGTPRFKRYPRSTRQPETSDSRISSDPIASCDASSAPIPFSVQSRRLSPHPLERANVIPSLPHGILRLGKRVGVDVSVVPDGSNPVHEFERAREVHRAERQTILRA